MRKNCETCVHDCLHNLICDECYNTSDAPTKWEAAEHYKPDTNAERIRAMSDEELAEFLDECENKGYVDSSVALDNHGKMLPMLEWLKQPAEVTDNGQA